jgi:hypothetical protein
MGRVMGWNDVQRLADPLALQNSGYFRHLQKPQCIRDDDQGSTGISSDREPKARVA